MTKEEAREILNDWAFWHTDNFGGTFTFPVYDEVVYSKFHTDKGELSNSSETNHALVQYTFRHVIKIAYDL